MDQGSDVLVIGGGAVGAACGRALALAGARVTVVDNKSAKGSAWRASAGMLAAQIEAGPDNPLFDMGIAGREFYLRESDRLLDSVNIDIGLNRTGILQLAGSADRASRLREKTAWQTNHGQQAYWLSSGEVETRWPWLRADHGGMWAPSDAILDPAALVPALLNDAARLGATLVNDRITSLWCTDTTLLGANGVAGRYSADVVVVALGAWSAQLEKLPRHIPVEPVKGQMIAVAWPDSAPTTTVYGDHSYLLRRGDEMFAGATEEKAGFDSCVNEDSTADFITRLSAFYPTLATAKVNRRWAGLRPVTPDQLPIIGPEERMPGLWYATGHGRNGILLAGVTGEMIAEGIGGNTSRTEWRHTSPARWED